MRIKWEIESLVIEFCDCDHLRKRRRDVTPRMKRPLATERRDACRALQNFIFSRSPTNRKPLHTTLTSFFDLPHKPLPPRLAYGIIHPWINRAIGGRGRQIELIPGKWWRWENWPCLFWPSVFPSHGKPHPALTQPRPVSFMFWHHFSVVTPYCQIKCSR